MKIDEMTVSATILMFEEAGLTAYYTPGKVFADFVACGDVEHGNISVFQWACHLKFVDDHWTVCPPPHFSGRRNPEYAVNELDQAVALTIFLFERRSAKDLMDGDDALARHDKYIQGLVAEWRRYQLESVAVVVDRQFGEQLSGLAKRLPVWIVTSEKNQPAIGSVREKYPKSDVTSFISGCDQGGEDLVLSYLYTVTEHHPSWRVMEVYGTPLTKSLEAAFQQFDVNEFRENSDGFVAIRSESPNV